MAKPNEAQVVTLTEFTKVVEDLSIASRAKHPQSPLQGNWYRGMGKGKSFKLLPYLYRHPLKKSLADLILLEKDMIDEFKRQSVLHDFPKKQDEASRFELLFHMQHYGVPTRLLDWTSNPFIALFFALTDPARDAKTKEDLVVWVLDAVSWNSWALKDIKWDERGPALTDDEEIRSYRPLTRYTEEELNKLKGTMYPYPISIVGGANSARMFAQKGVFTCFGAETTPMESIYETKGFPENSLFKIVIKANEAKSMLETLISIGYTDSVSYPDMHGLALEIKRLRGFSA